MRTIIFILLFSLFPSLSYSRPYVTPQMYGAKADGKTDDTKAIQAALDASNRVFFPAGTYITSKSLVVRSNTTVWGKGKRSRIINTVKTGFEKNVLVCGVIDSGNLPASPNLLPVYNATIGNDRRSFVSEYASEFSPGDIVLITCGGVNTKNPNYCFVSKISSIVDETFSLADVITNKFVEGKVQVRNLSRYPSVKSELHIDAYVAENIVVHDLCIEQEKDEGSGMYTIFASCYNSHFYNLWLKGNTCIGSNLTAMTTVDHIYARFDGGFCDMPEYNICSRISHVYGERFGVRGNRIGLSVFQGYGARIENCYIDFKGVGKIGFAEQITPTVRCNVFMNLASSAGCLESSIFGNAKIQDNYISCGDDYFAMTLFKEGNEIVGNQISTNKSKWYRGIDSSKNVLLDNKACDSSAINLKKLITNAKKLKKRFK